MVFKFSDTSFPSTSVNLFLHIVRPFNELLFCTLDMSTFIWAGLKSIPEVVNSKLVVFVFKSLIMCPNLPHRVLDSCYSSIFLLSSYYRRLISNAFSYSLSFSKLIFFLSSYSFILRSFYSCWRCYRYFSYLIRRISRTRVVLGSITSYVFLGRGCDWSILVLGRNGFSNLKFKTYIII